jgi:hypothetical protein
MTIKRIHENVDPAEIVLDAENANLGTERGTAMLQRSLQENGPGRAVLIDRQNRGIAGNKTLEAAIAAGIPLNIIDTYGEALLVHRRLDLDLDDPTGTARRMAYMDNRAGELNLAWDVQQIKQDHEAGLDTTEFFFPRELEAMGVEIDVDLGLDYLGKTGGGGPLLPPADTDPFLEVRVGQRWLLGGHILHIGSDLRTGDAVVMIRAWERYTGERAKLAYAADDDEDPA